MEIKYYKQCLRDIKDLTSKNKEVSKILKKGIENLKKINFEKALIEEVVKPLQGYEKVKKKLKESGYFPAIFEFRKFPKKYPFRIIFLMRDNKTEILLIATVLHKQMNNKFNKTVEMRLKSLLL